MPPRSMRSRKAFNLHLTSFAACAREGGIPAIWLRPWRLATTSGPRHFDLGVGSCRWQVARMRDSALGGVVNALSHRASCCLAVARRAKGRPSEPGAERRLLTPHDRGRSDAAPIGPRPHRVKEYKVTIKTVSLRPPSARRRRRRRAVDTQTRTPSGCGAPASTRRRQPSFRPRRPCVLEPPVATSVALDCRIHRVRSHLFR